MNSILLLMILAAADGPLITATPVVDLGKVCAGPVITHVFELKNNGSEVLSLGDVTTGCGCQKAQVEPKTLIPGKTAKLTVTVNTLTQPEGPVSWHATLFYTAIVEGGSTAVQQPFSVQLTGKLIREVAVTPPAIAASTTGALTQLLVVTDRRGTPLTVKTATSTNKSIAAEVKPAVSADGKRSQAVVITAGAELPVGTHDETITLTTDDPAYAELRVPVRIHKRAAGGPSVTPESLTVRLTKGQESTSIAAQIRAGGRPVTIAKVECADPAITLRWSEGAGLVATIRAVVNSTKSASGSSELRVTLSEPASTIVLPISWYTP